MDYWTYVPDLIGITPATYLAIGILYWGFANGWDASERPRGWSPAFWWLWLGFTAIVTFVIWPYLVASFLGRSLRDLYLKLLG